MSDLDPFFLDGQIRPISHRIRNPDIFIFFCELCLVELEIVEDDGDEEAHDDQGHEQVVQDEVDCHQRSYLE